MRLLADARRRRFRAVAVWSLDRFGRGLRQIVTNVYELAELGVKFACVTPLGKIPPRNGPGGPSEIERLPRAG